MLDPDQQARGQRLLSFLRQSFAGYSKAEGNIAHYVATNREGEAHGLEAIRLINREFSIQSRAEALGSSLFSLAVKEETQLHQFEVLLRSASGGGVTDGMALNEADKVLILMRNLPAEVRTHLQLHGRSSTFEELKNSVWTYDLNTRVLGDVHVQDLKSAGLPAVREGRLVLAVSARLGLSLVTIDISTAFLYASLFGERQVVKLPSSCKDARGNPVFLDLLKALYELRRAPVYWYRELKRALLKLGFEITADPALFRHYSSEFGLVLVVVYVDDCLFAGAHESCLHFIAALASDEREVHGVTDASWSGGDVEGHHDQKLQPTDWYSLLELC
eukprot:s9183_g1.t1